VKTLWHDKGIKHISVIFFALTTFAHPQQLEKDEQQQCPSGHEV
jgi:hypothetical protein